jgi:hypothetical protein
MMPLWLSIPLAVIAWSFIIVTILNTVVELAPAFRYRRWVRRQR